MVDHSVATGDDRGHDDRDHDESDQEPVVALLDDAWRSIGDLIDCFDDRDWSTLTALPGWTVKDCVSHLIGTELSLMGEPAPAVSVDHLPHVTTDFQKIVEVWVEARRGQPGPAIAAEYHEVIPRRLAELRAMPPAFAEPS